MKDIEVKISKESRMVDLSKSKIGNEAENLQGNLVFSFKDEFVNGQARLELTIDGQDSWIPLLKEEETYYCPIKSAITKKGKIEMQLVITENEDEDGIPIFKSNVFYVWVDKSINAEIEQPEEYPTWIEIANEKLNEMDNLDIDATKVGDTATITITKKDGTEESVEITDGPAGQDAKINGVNTLNIQAGDNIDISQSGSTMTISSTGGGGGATYTAGTGIEITQQNVINNTAPNKLISITVDEQTMELDKTAGEINSLIEQGYLILLMGRLMFIEEYDSSRNKLYAYFYSGGYATKFTITGNQVTDYESLDVVYDNHYTHTDNNYTNADKTKLDGLENKIINVNADQQTLQLDKNADEINEYLNNGYIVMTLGYQVFRKDYNSSTHTIQLAIFFGSFGQVITVTGNQVTGVSEYFYVNDQNYVHTDNNFSSYYKGKLDNAPEIVDLSSYQVGDTISDTALISQLMNDGCKIKYGNTIYSYARLDNNIVRLYTVMSDVDHGEYIALIIQGNDTLLFYEKENAYWEVPSNKVQNLNTPTTETYPSTLAVYNALQNIGGDSVYLGFAGDFTQQNPLDLNTLDTKLYLIRLNHKSSLGENIYLKCNVDGNDITGNLSLNKGSTLVVGDMIVLNVLKKVSDMTFTGSTTYYNFGWAGVDLRGSEDIDNQIEYRTTRIQITASGINTGLGENSTLIAVRTSGNQTITGKKTFSTIPELSSGLTPTTDYQLVNKKYVDDNAGGGDVSYILYDGGGTFFSKTGVVLTTDIGTSHLNVNIHPEICNYLTILREKFGQGASVKLKVFFTSDIYLYGTFTLNNNAYINEKLYSQNLVNEIPANSNGTNYVWDSSTNKYTTSKNYTDARRPSEFIPKTNNTLTYTPSGDYNPATKKYVDDKPTTYTGYDATKTQVLKNINGTLTWVDET